MFSYFVVAVLHCYGNGRISQEDIQIKFYSLESAQAEVDRLSNGKWSDALLPGTRCIYRGAHIAPESQ